MARSAQAANVLVITGVLSDELEKLLLAAGRYQTARKVFGNRGPLGDFSSKIDIAYMFELIERQTWQDLHVLRKIRNQFAHTSQYIDFETESIAKDCKKLSNWRARNNQECFMVKALECANAIRGKLGALMFAHALKESPDIVSGE